MHDSVDVQRSDPRLVPTERSRDTAPSEIIRAATAPINAVNSGRCGVSNPIADVDF